MLMNLSLFFKDLRALLVKHQIHIWLRCSPEALALALCDFIIHVYSYSLNHNESFFKKEVDTSVPE